MALSKNQSGILGVIIGIPSLSTVFCRFDPYEDYHLGQDISLFLHLNNLSIFSPSIFFFSSSGIFNSSMALIELDISGLPG